MSHIKSELHYWIVRNWIHKKPFFTLRMTDRQAIVVGRHFLGNEVRKLVTSRKTTDSIWTFRWKLELWKSRIHHHELDSVPVLQNFLFTNSIVNLTSVIFAYCLMLCQHLEDLHNSMNRYFQNDQLMIQSCVWVSHSKCKHTNGFDVTEHESSFIWLQILDYN